MKDTLGPIFKELEDNTRISGVPVIARLDGKNFHNWTRDLERPFDSHLSNTMSVLTQALVRETGATIGYSQSDEISLIWKDNIFFDGRVQKMVSVLASLCTQTFNDLVYFIDNPKPAYFDCRVFGVPSLDDAANYFLWRAYDCRKNAVSMAAHTYFVHSALQEKHSNEMIRMLASIGIDFHAYPDAFKYGIWVQKRKGKKIFSTEEIQKLPPLHNARKNPNLTYERTDYVVLNMPPFWDISNKTDVIFNGAEPERGCTA